MRSGEVSVGILRGPGVSNKVLLYVSGVEGIEPVPVAISGEVVGFADALEEGRQAEVFIGQTCVNSEAQSGRIVSDDFAIAGIVERILTGTNYAITVQIGVLDVASPPVIANARLIGRIINRILGLEDTYCFVALYFTEFLTYVISVATR
jgi:hypothetical protein